MSRLPSQPLDSPLRSVLPEPTVYVFSHKLRPNQGTVELLTQLKNSGSPTRTVESHVSLAAIARAPEGAVAVIETLHDRTTMFPNNYIFPPTTKNFKAICYPTRANGCPYPSTDNIADILRFYQEVAHEHPSRRINLKTVKSPESEKQLPQYSLLVYCTQFNLKQEPIFGEFIKAAKGSQTCSGFQQWFDLDVPSKQVLNQKILAIVPGSKSKQFINDLTSNRIQSSVDVMILGVPQSTHLTAQNVLLATNDRKAFLTALKNVWPYSEAIQKKWLQAVNNPSQTIIQSSPSLNFIKQPSIHQANQLGQLGHQVDTQPSYGNSPNRREDKQASYHYKLPPKHSRQEESSKSLKEKSLKQLSSSKNNVKPPSNYQENNNFKGAKRLNESGELQPSYNDGAKELGMESLKLNNISELKMSVSHLSSVHSSEKNQNNFGETESKISTYTINYGNQTIQPIPSLVDNRVESSNNQKPEPNHKLTHQQSIKKVKPQSQSVKLEANSTPSEQFDKIVLYPTKTVISGNKLEEVEQGHNKSQLNREASQYMNNQTPHASNIEALNKGVSFGKGKALFEKALVTLGQSANNSKSSKLGNQDDSHRRHDYLQNQYNFPNVLDDKTTSGFQQTISKHTQQSNSSNIQHRQSPNGNPQNGDQHEGQQEMNGQVTERSLDSKQPVFSDDEFEEESYSPGTDRNLASQENQEDQKAAQNELGSLVDGMQNKKLLKNQQVTSKFPTQKQHLQLEHIASQEQDKYSPDAQQSLKYADSARQSPHFARLQQSVQSKNIDNSVQSRGRLIKQQTNPRHDEAYQSHSVQAKTHAFHTQESQLLQKPNIIVINDQQTLNGGGIVRPRKNYQISKIGATNNQPQSQSNGGRERQIGQNNNKNSQYHNKSTRKEQQFKIGKRIVVKKAEQNIIQNNELSKIDKQSVRQRNETDQRYNNNNKRTQNVSRVSGAIATVNGISNQSQNHKQRVFSTSQAANTKLNNQLDENNKRFYHNPSYNQPKNSAHKAMMRNEDTNQNNSDLVDRKENVSSLNKSINEYEYVKSEIVVNFGLANGRPAQLAQQYLNPRLVQNGPNYYHQTPSNNYYPSYTSQSPSAVEPSFGVAPDARMNYYDRNDMQVANQPEPINQSYQQQGELLKALRRYPQSSSTNQLRNTNGDGLANNIRIMAPLMNNNPAQDTYSDQLSLRNRVPSDGISDNQSKQKRMNSYDPSGRQGGSSQYYQAQGNFNQPYRRASQVVPSKVGSSLSPIHNLLVNNGANNQLHHNTQQRNRLQSFGINLDQYERVTDERGLTIYRQKNSLLQQRQYSLTNRPADGRSYSNERAFTANQSLLRNGPASYVKPSEYDSDYYASSNKITRNRIEPINSQNSHYQNYPNTTSVSQGREYSRNVSPGQTNALNPGGIRTDRSNQSLFRQNNYQDNSNNVKCSLNWKNEERYDNAALRQDQILRTNRQATEVYSRPSPNLSPTDTGNDYFSLKRQASYQPPNSHQQNYFPYSPSNTYNHNQIRGDRIMEVDPHYDSRPVYSKRIYEVDESKISSISNHLDKNNNSQLGIVPISVFNSRVQAEALNNAGKDNSEKPHYPSSIELKLNTQQINQRQNSQLSDVRADKFHVLIHQPQFTFIKQVLAPFMASNDYFETYYNQKDLLAKIQQKWTDFDGGFILGSPFAVELPEGYMYVKLADSNQDYLQLSQTNQIVNINRPSLVRLVKQILLENKSTLYLFYDSTTPEVAFIAKGLKLTQSQVRKEPFFDMNSLQTKMKKIIDASGDYVRANKSVIFTEPSKLRGLIKMLNYLEVQKKAFPNQNIQNTWKIVSMCRSLDKQKQEERANSDLTNVLWCNKELNQSQLISKLNHLSDQSGKAKVSKGIETLVYPARLNLVQSTLDAEYPGRFNYLTYESQIPEPVPNTVSYLLIEFSSVQPPPGYAKCFYMGQWARLSKAITKVSSLMEFVEVIRDSQRYTAGQ